MWFHLLDAENSQNEQILLKNMRWYVYVKMFEWNDIKWQFRFHFENVLLLKNNDGALQVKGFCDMLCFMYYEVWLSHLSLFQGRISELKQTNTVVFRL